MKRLLPLIALLMFAGMARAQSTSFVPSCAGTEDSAAFSAIAAGADASHPRTISIPYKSDNTKRCAISAAVLASFGTYITLDNTQGSGINVLSGTPTVAATLINPPGRQVWFGAGTVTFTGKRFLDQNDIGTTAGTVAVGNDARFPTANEKAAFAGTSGTAPSGSNKFVDRAALETSPTQTVAINQSSVARSPLVWRYDHPDYIETVHPGAYINTIFSGPTAIIHYDPAQLVAGAVSAGNYPKLKWRVDRGAWSTAQLTSGGSTVSLASGLPIGKHLLELVVMATWGDDDRWLTPVASVRFTGLEIAGELTRPPMYSKVLGIWGDSIPEGVRVNSAVGTIADNDAVLAFPYLLRDRLHMEVANMGLGGMGWARTVISNLPNVTAYWKNRTSQDTLLNSVGSFIEPPPDVMLIPLGTNDTSSGDVTNNLPVAFTAMRLSAPKAYIIAATPFNGNQSAAMTTGFANYQAASPDDNAFLVDATIDLTGKTTDGTHLNAAGQSDAADKLYTLVTGILSANNPPPGSNIALSQFGAVADASSNIAGSVVAALNDGDRTGRLMSASHYWNQNDPAVAEGQWARITFPYAKKVAAVEVDGLQDAVFTNPVEPTDTLTGSSYIPVSFEVQYWTGAAWATFLNANVTANTRVVRTFNTFTPVVTTKIRVLFHTVGGGSGYANLTELRAYSVTEPALVAGTGQFSGTVTIKGTGNATLNLMSYNSTSPQVNLGNELGVLHWTIYETLGATGQQGSFKVYDRVAAADRLLLNTAGSLAVKTAAEGIILKSPDGLTCKKLTIDNAGAIALGVITCP